METHIIEWLNLATRWIHFITGVAWIGASFYFNWLENNLNRVGQREDIAGSLWAVHGGGFYYVEKYKIAPKEIPKTLHWFKYEAYFTWITGIGLLAIVYYANASLYLIDSNKISLTPLSAILISLGSLICSWFTYDQLCKSSLGKDNAKIAAVGFVLITAIAYGFSQIFTDRAAFIHVGAVIGTCMVANVFRVIIPSQKALVNAAIAGKNPDGILGKKAFQRSLHNNYMTLPILFIMISNHFPSTYSSHYNWAILAGLALSSAYIRHWFNLKGKGQYNVWILPFAFVAMIALAFVTSPQNVSNSQKQSSVTKTPFSTVQKLVETHCSTCHSSQPTDNIFKVAPAGVVFDTPELMKKWSQNIKQRAAVSQDMPFGNKTGITKEEREIIAHWVDEGANIEGKIPVL